ncbi:MAG: hypothetical protein RLO53_07210 [Salinisphaeraceae bacterium]
MAGAMAYHQEQLLKDLQKAGMSFMVERPRHGGTESVLLTPNQAVRFLGNPAAVLAETYEVSEADFLQWIEDRFSVRCAARTTRNRRCRATATGLSSVDPKTWVANQGALCSNHGAELLVDQP